MILLCIHIFNANHVYFLPWRPTFSSGPDLSSRFVFTLHTSHDIYRLLSDASPVNSAETKSFELASSRVYAKLFGTVDCFSVLNLGPIYPLSRTHTKNDFLNNETWGDFRCEAQIEFIIFKLKLAWKWS